MQKKTNPRGTGGAKFGTDNGAVVATANSQKDHRGFIAEALHILGLLTCREEEEGRGSKIYHRHYTLADGIDPAERDEPRPEPKMMLVETTER